MIMTKEINTLKKVKSCEKSLYQILEKGDKLREELCKHEYEESRVQRALNIARSADFEARQEKT